MSKDNLKVSVSGIRGIVGESLTLKSIIDYTAAFSRMLPRRSVVMVGRDTRGSGQMVRGAVCATLNAAGHTVVDLGIVPTPTVSLMVRKTEARAGIIITASHNPIEWNALKLVGEKGNFLVQHEINHLLQYYSEGILPQNRFDNIGEIREYPAAVNDHIEEIFNFVDIDAIKKRKFRIACDYVNGAALVAFPKMLFKMDAEEYSINNAITGSFAHKAEPGVDTMGDLARLVKKTEADIGFITDPDADRLALVDEKGNILSEEYTLALGAQYFWMRGKGEAAVNLSTSRMIDELALKYNTRVHRTKIGEINVTTKIMEDKLYFGGEGNGGLIYPPVSPGRDSLLAAAVILDLMTQTGMPLSALVEKIPPFVMLKEKVDCSFSSPNALADKLLSKYPNAKINTIDGVKADFEESWVHIRPSNTEPIVRVYIEAKDNEKAKALYKDVSAIIKQLS